MTTSFDIYDEEVDDEGSDIVVLFRTSARNTILDALRYVWGGHSELC